MRSRYASWTLAALLACAVMAWNAPAAAQETAPRSDSASTAELEALYEARTDSARTRFIEADVRFMSDMIHHHAQAVVMGRLAPTHGASPSIQTLAARIINAQEDEIATMERWLEDRGQPVPEVHIEATDPTPHPDQAMHEADHAPDVKPCADHTHMAHADHPADSTHGTDHAMDMPGMLTPAQMEELEAAEGAEFDRLFLTYMIQHHEGAVTMVHELFGTDGAAQNPATFKLASDIQVDQRTEIDRMEQMLSALPGEGGD